MCRFKSHYRTDVCECHEDKRGEQRYSSNHFQPLYEIQVNGQLHAPADIPPEPTEQVAVWAPEV
jgi:hypothetical protein